MTDQFSQEYIDYILSDKAKALQKKWEPRLGDHVWVEQGMRLVTGLDSRCYFLDEGARLLQLTEELEEAPLHRYEAPEAHHIEARRSVAWLPTLWDLVQIRVGKVRPPDNEVAEMASVLEWIASEALENAEPIMLAAAKLAVRALQ